MIDHEHQTDPAGGLTAVLDENALNEAGWAFIEAWGKYTDQEMHGKTWNNIKPMVEAAIRKYIEATNAADAPHAETTETLLQMLVDCDVVQAGGNPNDAGLCDAIDNDGCHYQSAALAGWLEVARKAGIRPMLRLEKAPNAGHERPAREDGTK